MKNMKKIATMLTALMLVLGLGAFAMAEGTTEAPAAESAAGTEAADALKEAEEKNQALNDAMTAYNNAKAESWKQARIASLKEELDAYVAAGSLTQEQADLLLSYYTEQIAQNQGMGRGGKGMRNGKHIQNGQNGQDIQNGQMNGFGRSGRQGGRFNQQAPTAPQGNVPTAPQGNDSAAPQSTGI